MKLLRGVLLALLVSLLVGIAIGTALRLRLERPIHYIGQLLNDNNQLQGFCGAKTRGETRRTGTEPRYCVRIASVAATMDRRRQLDAS